MPVVIKPLLAQRREEALLFIQPYEAECVNLAQEILRGGDNCWAIYYSDDEKIVGSSPTMTDDFMSFPRPDAGILQDQKLGGLFALRKKRSLFFCLPFAKYKSALDKKLCNEAQRPLAEFFESH
ncbi:MAG: hypothetical protein J5700_00920, partial [Treponema sp.]|nr:hypothetical protein [Treponema sp.]